MSLASGSSAPPIVSIVVPVRNEAANVAPLVEEIARALGKELNYEVIYVNDGSGLFEDVSARSGIGPNSLGYTGFGTAWSDVDRFAAETKPDRCADRRCVREEDSNRRPHALRFSRRLQVELLEAGPLLLFEELQPCGGLGRLNADGTRDTGCGLKAFRRDLFLALPYFDGLHRFLPALVRREGYDIGYLEVVDRPRHAGSSHYGLWDRLWIGILDLLGVWWLIRRRPRVPHALEVKANAD